MNDTKTLTAEEIEEAVPDCDDPTLSAIIAQARRVPELEAEVARLTAALESERAALRIAIARLGGRVEGNPTSRLNFLQRIEELRSIEALAAVGMKVEE